jgi:endonuclease/exonuclease/phosphatase family metal-dependent hydrolase
VTRAWLRPHHESQTIRVLTFNILSVDHAAGERRRRVARSELQAIRPDIVALQKTTPGDAHDVATDLLGPGYHIVEHPSGSGDTVGAALASRWPFAAVHELDLSVRPRVPSAAAVLAEVELPGPFGRTVFVHHAAHGKPSARSTPATHSHRQTRWYALVRCHSSPAGGSTTS